MKLALVSLFVLGASALAPAHAADPLGAEAARADIRATLGFVPGFFSAFPDEAIGGAWDEFKRVQLSSDTALPPKYKELIGLAVASQVPCSYCVYFHTKAATANGATDREVKEAVALAGVVRHWSTLFNGAALDERRFTRDLDKVIANVLAAAKATPRAATAPKPIVDAASAKADIAATLGFVPMFFDSVPDVGLPGAWRELKGLQLAPDTALPNKLKELIGLAVAAQIPCHYCTTFHTRVATKLFGASEVELREAVAMAAVVRHWSTFLNGAQIDHKAFEADVDRALGGGKSANR